MSKISITFLTNQTEYTGDGEDDIEFIEGKSYTMSEGSANHWLSRGVAELTEDKKAKAKEKAEAEAKEKAEAEKNKGNK